MTSSTVPQTPLWRSVALLLVYFGAIVLLQVLSGAYHAEFSGYPDESAHYVTSLMVRDYILGRDYWEPMRFAKDYYDHYPKVAFGHWPPLFYALGGPWMVVFSCARTSVLLGLAVLTTCLAWLTQTVVRRHFGYAAGALSGLLLICLPIVQIYSDEVMAESLLAIVSLAAAIFFARFLERERWQDSACFGLFASLAIMTKGNGWDLALVPPIALVLTRKFSLLTKRTFWLSAVIVVLICAPWQWVTMSMAQRGWGGGDKPSVAYTLTALWQFLFAIIDLVGWGLSAFVLLGIAVTIAGAYFKKTVQPEWATMFALIPAAWIFHSIVPAGVESRKLIIAVPSMILLLFAGCDWIAKRFRWNPLLVVAGAMAIFCVESFRIPRETHFGYTEAARFIHDRKDFQNARILVSSERDGEGMLISELAMVDARPAHQVLRATKVLSRTDWSGKVFACFYQTPEKLVEYLHRAGIGLVVSDTLPPMLSFEYQRVLSEAIAKYPAQLKLIASFKGDAKGVVNVYSVN